MGPTRETYDAVADEYASRHVDRTGIMDQFDRFCGMLDDDSQPGDSTGTVQGSVLDVGCGPGWETAELTRRGYQAIGLDVSHELLRYARTNIADTGSGADDTFGHVTTMDMRHLGFPPNALSGIWACASVHHVPRDEIGVVFDEFARVLAPDGALAVSVKRGSGTMTGDAYPEDDRRFTCYQPQELAQRLAESGFETTHVDASENWGWTWARLTE